MLTHAYVQALKVVAKWVAAFAVCVIALFIAASLQWQTVGAVIFFVALACFAGAVYAMARAAYVGFFGGKE